MGEERIVTPVTLPRLSFTAKPPPDDNAANAAAIITVRIIRCGRDAWEGIAKAETFDAWKNIGAALAIGKAHALKVTGANAAWGQNYSREFGKWIKEHGFGDMRPSDRSYAIALHEQFGAIVAWRATLSDRERNRLRCAQSNVRRWQRTRTRDSQCPGDLKRRATMHWRRFVSAMKLLPPGEAESLWRQSLFEMVGQ